MKLFLFVSTNTSNLIFTDNKKNKLLEFSCKLCNQDLNNTLYSINQVLELKNNEINQIIPYYYSIYQEENLINECLDSNVNNQLLDLIIEKNFNNIINKFKDKKIQIYLISQYPKEDFEIIKIFLPKLYNKLYLYTIDIKSIRKLFLIKESNTIKNLHCSHRTNVIIDDNFNEIKEYMNIIDKGLK